MSTTGRYQVGPKGQVVIAKEIRDQLGVRPGWLALQRVVQDHVELRFLPPDDGSSLKGALAPHTTVSIPPGDAWDAARRSAWDEAARRELERRD